MAELASYHFSIHYQSGRLKVDADALSQIKWQDETVTTLDEGTLRAIIDMGCTGDRTILESYTCSIQIPNMGLTPCDRQPQEDELVTFYDWVGMQAPSQMANGDWVREQGCDPVVA